MSYKNVVHFTDVSGISFAIVLLQKLQFVLFCFDSKFIDHRNKYRYKTGTWDICCENTLYVPCEVSKFKCKNWLMNILLCPYNNAFVLQTKNKNDVCLLRRSWVENRVKGWRSWAATPCSRPVPGRVWAPCTPAPCAPPLRWSPPFVRAPAVTWARGTLPQAGWPVWGGTPGSISQPSSWQISSQQLCQQPLTDGGNAANNQCPFF